MITISQACGNIFNKCFSGLPSSGDSGGSYSHVLTPTDQIEDPMGQLGRRVSDAFPSPEVLGDTSKGEQNLLTSKVFMGLGPSTKMRTQKCLN